MRPPLNARFVDKAQAAMLAAIEIYNKPTISYREETFCILALNAWELLLKAKILRDKGNNPRDIQILRAPKKKDGTPSKTKVVVKNRAGNPMTISIKQAQDMLDTKTLPESVRVNIDALTEIRDNAAHYVTASTVLATQVMEIAYASINNFVLLARAWFDRDVADSMRLIMPIAFINGSAAADVVSITKDESRLIERLKALAATPEPPASSFHVALRMDIKLNRSSLDNITKVQIVRDDPTATRVVLAEEDVRKTFPWDYKGLVKALRKRYSDFKENGEFHAVRKPFQGDVRYVKERLLDPANPSGTKKDFYNPNIVVEFDKHYTKK